MELENDFGILPPQFQIGEIVGRGATGVVVRARNLAFDADVALKILSRAGSEVSNERFAREARILASLDHPNIVKILSSGTSSKGNRFHVMEWLEGQSLAQRLSEQRVLPDAMFFDLFIQLLSALQYAHSKGVVHRDVKPSNIMLLEAAESGGCRAKLVDFGIASRLKSENISSAELTETGWLLGTPLYMSPEQCTGLELSASSDIYSLACVMCECLTGNPLFNGETAMEIMYKHIHDEPVLPEIAAQASPGGLLTALLARCLEKDPQRRPDSSKVLREVQDIYEDCSGRLIRVSLDGASKPARSRLLLPLFVSAAVVFLIICIEFRTLAHKPARMMVGRAQRAEESKQRREGEILGQLGSYVDTAEKHFLQARDKNEKSQRAEALAERLLDRVQYSGTLRPRSSALLHQAEADCLRILQLIPLFDPQEKGRLKAQVLWDLANLHHDRKHIATELGTLAQALACAKKWPHLSLLETDILADRAKLLLTYGKYAEAESDVGSCIEIWKTLRDHDLGKSKPEVPEKAVALCRAIIEHNLNASAIPFNEELATLKLLGMVTIFLLQRGELRSDQSSELQLLLSKTIDKSTVLSKGWSAPGDKELNLRRREVLELAAKLADLEHEGTSAAAFRRRANSYIGKAVEPAR